MKTCECGCGESVRESNRYVFGHALKDKRFHHTGSIKGKRPDLSVRNIIHNARYGKDAHNWRGGLSWKGAGYEMKVCCERCLRGDVRLSVHHIDRNPKNNSFNNLITVCYKCHNGYYHKDSYPKGFLNTHQKRVKRV